MQIKPKKQKSFIMRAILLLALIYATVSVIQLQLKIGSAKEELAVLQQQVSDQQLKNSQLSDKLAADKKSQIEQAARDQLGLVYPDERIYVDIS